MAAGAGYKQVLSTSASGLRNEIEPYELEEDPHLQDVDVEQQERLLPDKEDGETSDHDNDLNNNLKRDNTQLRLAWILTSAGLLVLLLLAVFLRISTRGRGGAGDSGDFRRPASDYILDADWNFGASPQVREYYWTIQEIVANPDGVFRPMLTVNGKFPGEMIRCNEGDTIVVNVENKATNATSIHWHGLFQNGTNWMDGTPGVTQCPIAPGGTFRYEFTVEGQTGTCKSRKRLPP